MAVSKARKAVEDAGYTIKTLEEYGELQFVSSGIKEIDAITKFPRSRITEIYGLQGVGKSDLVLTCLSAMSKDCRVLYIDAENALNPARLLEKGGNPKNIVISDVSILEEAAKLTIKAVGDYDIIVVDSVATLIPRAESDGETGDQFVGLKARLMGQWMRQINAPLGKSNCALIFINQIREGMSIYVPKFTPGGKALPYAASLRLELSASKSERIVKDGVSIGHKVNVEVTKSRVCPPHQKTSFKLYY